MEPAEHNRERKPEVLKMFLTKYRPSGTFDSIFDDWFPAFKGWNRESADGEAFRLPVTNVNETDEDFRLTMEMPGVEKKDVRVEIENDQIIVTGEKTEKTETEGLLRREIRSEKFRRSFLLDSAIDRDKVKAKLENGVLKVTLPKKAESVGRKVNID
jgi:HSP20 family protein